MCNGLRELNTSPRNATVAPEMGASRRDAADKAVAPRRERRAEMPGLMTFEENTLSIIGISARGSATISKDAFQDHIAQRGPFAAHFSLVAHCFL